MENKGVYLIYVRYVISKNDTLLWKKMDLGILEGHSISHSGRMETFFG